MKIDITKSGTTNEYSLRIGGKLETVRKDNEWFDNDLGSETFKAS